MKTSQHIQIRILFCYLIQLEDFLSLLPPWQFKEVMFLVALVSLSVCLSVCLSVDSITQKVMNGLG